MNSAGIFPNSGMWVGDPYNPHDYQIVDYTSYPHDYQIVDYTSYQTVDTKPTITTPLNELVVVELNAIRESLNHCMACGVKDVFVLCPLCREAIKEIRERVLTEALESMRP